MTILFTLLALWLTIDCALVCLFVMLVAWWIVMDTFGVGGACTEIEALRWDTIIGCKDPAVPRDNRVQRTDANPFIPSAVCQTNRYCWSAQPASKGVPIGGVSARNGQRQVK